MSCLHELLEGVQEEMMVALLAQVPRFSVCTGWLLLRTMRCSSSFDDKGEDELRRWDPADNEEEEEEEEEEEDNDDDGDDEFQEVGAMCIF